MILKNTLESRTPQSNTTAKTSDSCASGSARTMEFIIVTFVWAIELVLAKETEFWIQKR